MSVRTKPLYCCAALCVSFLTAGVMTLRTAPVVNDSTLACETSAEVDPAAQAAAPGSTEAPVGAAHAMGFALAHAPVTVVARLLDCSITNAAVAVTIIAERNGNPATPEMIGLNQIP